jgi:hypothetical protein
MAARLVIYLNGAETYAFDKREGLARMQFAYVQRMDADMDRGIVLDGRRILSPAQAERNQFVIGRLLDAVAINDSRDIAMLCRYLAQHAPELDAIRVDEAGDEYRVELIQS